MKKRDLSERFWEKVDIRGEDECWEWQAHRDRKGYGKFQIDNSHVAHRVAWELENGQIPDGLFVCHVCDNPACCNPSHLFIGTNDDNMKDMKAKERSNRGTQRFNSKLTPIDVIGARSLYQRGAMSTQDIAEHLGVCEHTARSAIFGKSWSWLMPETICDSIVPRGEWGGPSRKGSLNGRNILDEHKVKAIREKINCGMRQCAIAAEYGVSPTTIGAIATGQNWGWLQ